MAFDTIGVGTSANDGTGDTIRASFVKVNDNFDKTVEGPASVTDNRIAVFDGTTGKLLQEAAFVEADVARLGAANTFTAAVTVNAAAVFNETSADVDFRVESDDNANMLFVDGGEDRVGIGTGTPAATLDVAGSAIFNDAGADVDFRVESDDNANMLFIDGGEDRVGIGTGTPSVILDIDGNTVRLRTARTIANEDDAGAAGEICWDADYIYVCTATDTWKRVAIATWP